MAISEVSSLSSLSNSLNVNESRKSESVDQSHQDNRSAVSVDISRSATTPIRQDIVTIHSKGLQRAQSRFERIDSDRDGSASLQELIAIRKELNDKGRQTPGLDRAIENFDKLDQEADTAFV